MAPKKATRKRKQQQKKAAPHLTHDSQFNQLMKSLDAAIAWERVISTKDDVDEGDVSRREKAANDVQTAIENFVLRPPPDDFLELGRFICNDEQRCRTRKLWREVSDAIEGADSERHTDLSVALPTLEGFLRAFGMPHGQETTEEVWLPVKRTPVGEESQYLPDTNAPEGVKRASFVAPEIPGLLDLQDIRMDWDVDVGEVLSRPFEGVEDEN